MGWWTDECYQRCYFWKGNLENGNRCSCIFGYANPRENIFGKEGLFITEEEYPNYKIDALHKMSDSQEMALIPLKLLVEAWTMCM